LYAGTVDIGVDLGVAEGHTTSAQQDPTVVDSETATKAGEQEETLGIANPLKADSGAPAMLPGDDEDDDDGPDVS
jgi:hypothetical protein